jgi:hypothetical protein
MNQNLQNEIRSFNIACDFKNTYDMYFYENYDPYEDYCELFRLTCLKNALSNLIYVMEYLKESSITPLSLIMNSGTNFVADFRYEGLHYHLYMPQTYSLTSFDRCHLFLPGLMKNNQTCPICYDTLRYEVIKCPNCGINLCIECSKSTTKCCICRYTNSSINENLIFTPIYKPTSTLNILFSVQYKTFLSFSISTIKEVIYLLKLISSKHWKYEYEGRQEYSDHPCLEGDPIIYANVTELYNALSSSS